jgi:hypothetical protein
MRIVPQSQLKADELKKYLDGFKSQLLAKAKEEMVRDLLPLTDLGYSTEEWDNENALNANAWTNDIDHELDDDEEVVILGIFNLTLNPQVIAVRFRVGGTGATTYGIYNLQTLYAQDEVVGWLDEPIVYKPKSNPYIDYYARAAVTAGSEKIGLIGFIRKPYGEEVSKPPLSI